MKRSSKLFTCEGPVVGDFGARTDEFARLCKEGWVLGVFNLKLPVECCQDLSGLENHIDAKSTATASSCPNGAGCATNGTAAAGTSLGLLASK